jgi:hypothetical protein
MVSGSSLFSEFVHNEFGIYSEFGVRLVVELDVIFRIIGAEIMFGIVTRHTLLHLVFQSESAEFNRMIWYIATTKPLPSILDASDVAAWKKLSDHRPLTAELAMFLDEDEVLGGSPGVSNYSRCEVSEPPLSALFR